MLGTRRQRIDSHVGDALPAGLRSVWVLLASGAPRQVAQLLSECPGSGLSIAMRPATKPGVIVEEELPVADDAVPHEQKRHGRLEWSEARVVERSSLVALVIGPVEDSVFDVRRNGKLLEDAVDDALRTV